MKRILRSRALDGVRHGFSTRLGGVSEGPWASLNLGRSTGDVLERVAENHRLLAEAGGFAADALVTPDQQVHGKDVRVVSPGVRVTGDCDALVTNTPGVGVGVRAADCVPVLLWDPRTRAVAAVHAGWRGVAARIPAESVRTLVERFDVDPSRLLAAIGPSIDACCYEVDDATAKQLEAVAPRIETRPSKPGHVRVGLRAAIEWQLVGAGLLASAIERVGGCTSCEADLFFSHRRDKGRTGRQLSYVFGEGTP